MELDVPESFDGATSTATTTPTTDTAAQTTLIDRQPLAEQHDRDRQRDDRSQGGDDQRRRDVTD